MTALRPLKSVLFGRIAILCGGEYLSKISDIRVKNMCPRKTKIIKLFLWKSILKMINILYTKSIDISFFLRYYRGSF